MIPDTELLSRYAARRDETAFAELVDRHIHHVYSCALRLTAGDTHLAEDVTQSVFTDLAHKASRLRSHQVLAGWLHSSTRFAAAKAIRTEQRRRHRESSAATMTLPSSEHERSWETLKPVLDHAIGQLSTSDRDALLLRFFEKKPLADVGLVLGVSENAARMRVDRALDRLRSKLAAMGITSSIAALATALAGQVVTTAPLGFGRRVVDTAVASASSGGIGLMAWLASLPGGLKIGTLGIVTALVAVVVAQFSPPPDERLTRMDNGPAAALEFENPREFDATAQSPTSVDPLPSGMPDATPNSATNTDPLELIFVDALTERPLASETIALRGWVRGRELLVERTFTLNEHGACRPDFDPQAAFAFWILTRVEGYADARLRWNPSRGEIIPAQYIVRLVRPVSIGGFVLDPDGKPIGGATVGINAEDTADLEHGPEDHGLDYLTTRTDQDGRWSLHRIAPEVISRLTGDASHPEFGRSASIAVSHTPAIEQELRAGTFAFRLNSAAVVEGTVVDAHGTPVPGARVIVGNTGEINSREAQTDHQGAFALRGCRLGETIITASASEHAPTITRIEIRPGMEPVRLALQAPKTLQMRVSDLDGTPIPGARAWLNTFPLQPNEPIPQVEFVGHSDAEGRITWNEAPDLDLNFHVSAKGYMQRFDIHVRPDTQEHAVTLAPALVIHGTVTDQVAGDSVPRFRICIGWAQEFRGTRKPWWSDIDRFSPAFAGGVFRHEIDEPVIKGGEALGYFFRFEAPGYASEISRFVAIDEREVRFDIALRPAPAIPLLVFTPDGKPAARAEAALLADGVTVELSATRLFAQKSLGTSAWVRQADSQGWLSLPNDPSIVEIRVAHPDGTATLSQAELRKIKAVRLEPWGTVKGQLLEADQPVAHVRLSLAWAGRKGPGGMRLDPGAYSTVTDAHGAFAFHHVPAGEFQLIQWQPEEDGNSRHGFAIHSLALRSGETRSLTVSPRAVR